jgi:hypothetical protein
LGEYDRANEWQQIGEFYDSAELRSNLAATLANGLLHTPASGQHWCHDASLSIADICKK